MKKYGSPTKVGNSECISLVGYKFPSDVPKIIRYCNKQYILTTGKYCFGGRIVCLLEAAVGYFYGKATEETKHFVDKIMYVTQSVEINGILHYTGRILCNQGIEGVRTLDVCFDLSKATFCVPPIAHAVVNETHWYHPDVKYTGVESVLRYANRFTYILGGRQLAKDVKKYCTKCCILDEAVTSIWEQSLIAACV